MDNRITIGVISVFVVLAVIGSALTPMIDAYTTTTTTFDNDGAIGLRMDKVTSGDFTLTYGLVGDDFTATNGTDTQIIDDVCIFYADDNIAVWMNDSSIRMLGKDANDQTIDAALSDDATITITKSADGVNITDGTVDQTFPVPAWSFVPKSAGAYAFFPNETEINTAGLDVHYVGSFAGVDCYDSINSAALPISLDASITGSILTGAKWAIPAADPETELTPLEPGSIKPLDPSVISLDPEPDADLMAVTPQYTSGDWGYNLLSSGKASIVTYTGASGIDLTIPATIDGYDVYSVGKGGLGNTLIPQNTPMGNVIISPGIEKISSFVFSGCNMITGTLTIPDTVTIIDQSAFTQSTFTGSLKIPSSVTTINKNAFYNCPNFTGTLVIPESVTSIGDAGFNTCPGLTGLVIYSDSNVTIASNAFTSAIKEILNFGTLELTTTSYGLNADEIRTDIPALGYLATAQYTETVTDDSPMAALLHVIPLITIIAVVMMAVGVFIAHRME